MRRILESLFAAAVIVGCCVAQSAQTQATTAASEQTSPSAVKNAQVTSVSQLQAGSTVQAELTKPVDAKKNKVGDEVIAKTTHDVKSGGHVVIPKGSRLVGHVTEVKAHTKEQATSQLGIAFDHAILRNGTQMPLALTIQALGRSQASAAEAEDDALASGNAGAMESSGARASSGGLAGGVRSTAGSVVNTAGSAAGAAVNTAGAAGGTVSSSLSATSQGVVGIPGLSLSPETSTSANASVISAQGSNVHLDGGTEMILRVNH
jgi:hypothetical protein